MNVDENIELAKKLADYTRAYVSNLQTHKRDSDKRFEIADTATRTRLYRLRDSIASTGENIMRIEHEIHCLCIELGLAEREDWRYGNEEVGAALGELHGSTMHYRREPNTR